MPLDFPSTIGQPTDGSYKIIIGNITYYWDGTSWSTSKPSSLVPPVPPVVDGGFTGADIDNWNESYSWGNYKGASTVNSIKDLSSSDTTEEVQYVKQYYADYSAEAELSDVTQIEIKGKGLFLWNPDVPKSRHDGGLFISPTVPYDGTRASLEDFLSGTGETDPTGNGVWVRQFEGDILADFFGCVGNQIVDDHLPIQKAINVCASLNDKDLVGHWKVGSTNKVRITGNCRIAKYISVPGNITLTGESNNGSYPGQYAGYANDYNILSQPVIWVDENCILYNDRAPNIEDNCAIVLESDSSQLEGLVVDGFDLPIGTWNSQIRGTNADGASVEIRPRIEVLDQDDDYQGASYSTPQITTITIPSANIGDPWVSGFQFTATGGNRTGVGVGTSIYTNVSPSNPYQWDVIEVNGVSTSTLPATWNLSPSGWLTCGSLTHDDVGIDYIKVRVADADGQTKTEDFSLEVVGKYIKPLYVDKNWDSLPTATMGATYEPYTVELINDDGQPHYWWLLNAPSGLSINQTTGEITGTPTNSGSYKVKILLTSDSDNSHYAKNDIIDEYEAELIVTQDEYPKVFNRTPVNAYLNVPYSHQFRVYGGTPPYTWEIDSSATLPSSYQNDQPGYPTSSSPAPGLTLDQNTGLLSGTPTSSGNFHFQIKVTDSTGKVYSSLSIFRGRAYSQIPHVKLDTWGTLPTAVKGQPYSYQLESTEPITYDTTVVALPTGLTISETGLISGTPTGARIANAVSLKWGAKMYRVQIRNFQSGAAILALGPVNVLRFDQLYLTFCRYGLKSERMYDSRMTNFYIFGCDNGLMLGSGSAANTFSNGRLETMFRNAIEAEYAHEGIYTELYFDVNGRSAYKMTGCKKCTITGNMIYRNGRYAGYRGKIHLPKVQSKNGNRHYSHMHFLDCDNCTITGNTFGKLNPQVNQKPSSSSNYEQPFTSIYLENSKKMTISGNNLHGCTDKSVYVYDNPYQFDDSSAIVEGNMVNTKNYYSKFEDIEKSSGKNLLLNSDREIYTNGGYEKQFDQYYNSVTLLLHADDFTDNGTKSYSLNNSGVAVSTTEYKFSPGSFYFNGSSSFSINETSNGDSSAGFYFGHDAFTIEMWINPSVNNVDQTIFDLGTNNQVNPFAAAMNTSGNLILSNSRTTSGQTVFYTSSAVIPVDEWTHIAICKTGNFGGDVRVYINGVQDGATLLTEFDNRFIISGYLRPIFGLGGFTSASDYFTGYMDEIRFTKGVSRFGTVSSFQTELNPFGNADYGVVNDETKIFEALATYTPQLFADGTLGFDLGLSSNIGKYIKIVRKNKIDSLSSNIGGYHAGQINPAYYYYNVSKSAEDGAVEGDSAQKVNFQLYLSKNNDARRMYELSGKRLAVSFWARHNSPEQVTKVSLEFKAYSGSQDDAYKVYSIGLDSHRFFDNWRRYYVEFDYPSFELVEINNAGNCNSRIEFELSERHVDYNIDIGGVMVHTVGQKFNFTPYTE